MTDVYSLEAELMVCTLVVLILLFVIGVTLAEELDKILSVIKKLDKENTE